MASRTKKKTPEQEALELAALKKEQRSQQMIGMIAVGIIVLIIALSGFFIWKGHQPKTADVVPSFVTSNGAIVITKDGIEQDGKKWDNVNSAKTNTINGLPVLTNGQDPLCPGCGALEREIGAAVEYWVDNGKLVYKSWPISILNRLSNGTEYSTRVAAAFYRMAELEPDHYLDFVKIMYESGVQPNESAFKDISDEKIAEYAEKAGVSKENAQKVIDGKYKDYVDANSENLSKDESLYRDANGTKTFMTPLLVINGEVLDDFNQDDMTSYIASKLGLKVPSDDELKKYEALPIADESTDGTESKKTEDETSDSTGTEK